LTLLFYVLLTVYFLCSVDRAFLCYVDRAFFMFCWPCIFYVLLTVHFLCSVDRAFFMFCWPCIFYVLLTVHFLCSVDRAFFVLLTVRLGIIFVNNQLDVHFFFIYVYFYSLHVSGSMCPSSGEIIVSIRHLVYVTLYRLPFGVQVWMSLIQTCTPNGHLYSVTYTRCRIDTINSLNDGHMAARNM